MFDIPAKLCLKLVRQDRRVMCRLVGQEMEPMRKSRIWLFGAALGVAVAMLPSLVAADSLKSIFGPAFSSNSHHGRHFASRLNGGGNLDARLGTHGLRRYQELQSDRPLSSVPYNQRYRLAIIGGGRPIWPNSDVRRRGSTIYQGEKFGCHRIVKSLTTAAGKRVRIAGTRCYDDYGQPRVSKASQRILDLP